MQRERRTARHYFKAALADEDDPENPGPLSSDLFALSLGKQVYNSPLNAH